MVASSIIRRYESLLIVTGKRPSIPLLDITMLCTCEFRTPTWENAHFTSNETSKNYSMYTK
jgi:hypothetical protein